MAERVTEIALVLLLFSDAARLDLRSLRRELGWPSRLLLIGLPLTMVAGAGVGVLVFPGMALARVVLLSTMLASTDAALGQKVVTDTSVPARVRQALDVESGLNDGLAVPFFLVAARHRQRRAQDGRHLGGRQQRGRPDRLGARWPARRGRRSAGSCSAWPTAAAGSSGEWRQIVPLAVALLAYAARGRRSAAAASSPPSSAAWRSAASRARAARS